MSYTRECFACPGVIDCGLPYFLNDENSDQDVTMHFHRWRELLKIDDDVYYPTFADIYLPKFCAHGQEGRDKYKCICYAKCF